MTHTNSIEETQSTEVYVGNLIQEVRTGNQEALIQLYDATGSLLFGLILRVVGDRVLAEEVLLDGYTRIWDRSERFTGAHPLMWLTSIARQCAVDRLRSSEQTLQNRALFDQDRSGTAEEPAEFEIHRLVRSSFDSLIPQERRVLEAGYTGLSQDEIASVLHIPLKTVKSTTRLGMMRLGEKLRQIL